MNDWWRCASGIETSLAAINLMDCRREFVSEQINVVIIFFLVSLSLMSLIKSFCFCSGETVFHLSFHLDVCNNIFSKLHLVSFNIIPIWRRTSPGLVALNGNYMNYAEVVSSFHRLLLKFNEWNFNLLFKEFNDSLGKIMESLNRESPTRQKTK